MILPIYIYIGALMNDSNDDDQRLHSTIRTVIIWLHIQNPKYPIISIHL